LAADYLAKQRNLHMTYWRLHYHLIWATFKREPSLTPEREKIFYGVIYTKAKELDLKIHAAGNIEDHAHIVLSIPPRLAIADCVRHLKGASTHAINHMEGSDGNFKWQEGYGALTIGERSLQTVMAYAARQKEHHKEQSLVAIYERIDEE
jgi:putative transposase